MTKQELHQAYLETTFRVLKSDIFVNNVDLHINQIDIEIKLVAPHIQTWAFISAFNPSPAIFSLEENLLRNQQLSENLTALNLTFHPAIGISKDEKWSEESFFIENISQENAFKLAAKYGQLAFVYAKTKEKIQLIYCK